MTIGARPSRRTLVLLLLASLMASLFCVAYPIYVIRPFRHQGARELAVALMVARFRATATVFAAIAAILAAISYWRLQPARWARGFVTVGATLAVVLGVGARVNIYELMFHPLVHPTFTAASDVKLNGAEMVIAVQVGGEARAYPIRGMSYHHVVNDVVGGTAIVATY
jgi:hypothetical protein